MLVTMRSTGHSSRWLRHTVAKAAAAAATWCAGRRWMVAHQGGVQWSAPTGVGSTHGGPLESECWPAGQLTRCAAALLPFPQSMSLPQCESATV